MYGPKIDFITKDSIGRTLQVATIQLDFNIPKNFDLTCTNEKGEKEPVVMIHAAIMGSIERFMGTLIEHYAGAFPLWLSPVQVKILPITEKHAEFAKKVFDALVALDIRAELDDSNEGLGKKVRNAKIEKIPYMLVIGDNEVEKNVVTLESRDVGKLGEMSVEQVTEKLQKEIGGKK